MEIELFQIYFFSHVSCHEIHVFVYKHLSLYKLYKYNSLITV